MVQTQLPVISGDNNGELNSQHAMPQKDITSDGTSDFARGRRYFWRFLGDPSAAISTVANTNQSLNSIDGKSRLAQISANVQQKKWGNTNRDASQIAARKRVMAIGNGSFNDANHALSFTTTRSINTEYDAIVRCRAGGYCVPKKVTQKNLNRPNPKYYRVISAGYANAQRNAAGFYEYTPDNLTGTLVMNHAKSYNLIVISRKYKTVIEQLTYDVFLNVSYATALINKLNLLDSTVFVVVFTYDEPLGNSSSLQTALQRCGASSSFPSQIKYRGAYVLLGIPGIGMGGGIERYVGDSIEAGDPNAYIDFRFSVDLYRYSYISG